VRWIVLIVGLLTPGAVGAEGPPALVDSAGTGAEPDSSLSVLFHDVARAWQDGEVELLDRHLGRRGVYLSISRGPVLDGRFSRNQARMILSTLLRRAGTESFEFIRFRNLVGMGGRPSGVALWTHGGGGRGPVGEMIFISAAREEGEWALAEVRQRLVTETPR